MVKMFKLTETMRIEDVDAVRFNDSSVWLLNNGLEREAPRFSDSNKYFETRQDAVDFAIKDMMESIRASRERLRGIMGIMGV